MNNKLTLQTPTGILDVIDAITFITNYIPKQIIDSNRMIYPVNSGHEIITNSLYSYPLGEKVNITSKEFNLNRLASMSVCDMRSIVPTIPIHELFYNLIHSDVVNELKTIVAKTKVSSYTKDLKIEQVFEECLNQYKNNFQSNVAVLINISERQKFILITNDDNYKLVINKDIVRLIDRDQYSIGYGLLCLYPEQNRIIRYIDYKIPEELYETKMYHYSGNPPINLNNNKILVDSSYENW